MKRPQIGIINSSSFGKHFPSHLERLRHFADIKQLQIPSTVGAAKSIIEQLVELHGIIVSTSPDLNAPLLKQLPKLIVISRHGIGYDNIDIASATANNIVVCKVPGPIEQEAVAEHTIGLMLAVMRHTIKAHKAVCGSQWKTRAQFIGKELRGSRIGIIGIGNIGRRVAEILSLGFRAEVVAYDPHVSESETAKRHAKAVSLDELLRTADVISLHCSLDSGSERLLGQRELTMLKRGAIIINNARAEILDQSALISQLQAGAIGGYGTDVVEGAPIAGDHPLLACQNVIVVPHLGAYTFESLAGMGERVVQDMEEIFLKKTIPDNAINPEVGTHLRQLI